MKYPLTHLKFKYERPKFGKDRHTDEKLSNQTLVHCQLGHPGLQS